jgi:hypothetical protein
MNLFGHRRHANARRLIVLAALGGFLAATVGVPVVLIDGDGKDRSQPYPCMNHVCGCQSAEACWRGCCCFTMTQKLAWAEAHGVTPPAFVAAAAKRETKAAACCQASAGCCTEHHLAAHDHATDGPAAHEHREDGVAFPLDITANDSGMHVEFVWADALRHCQGLGRLWLLLGAALPAPHIEYSIELLPAGEVTILSRAVASLSLLPAVPPPRSV